MSVMTGKRRNILYMEYSLKYSSIFLYSDVAEIYGERARRKTKMAEKRPLMLPFLYFLDGNVKKRTRT